MKQILIAMLTGALVTGTILGTVGYFQFQSMSQENTRLASVVRKQSLRLKKLDQSKSRLQTELDHIQDEKNQTYEQTIDALMLAKDNATIESLYTIGIRALEAKDAPLAYFALVQLHEKYPNYKEISRYYPLAEKAHQQYQQVQLEEKLKAAYAKGLDQQAQAQFAEARNSFQEVVNLRPDFKDAKARLSLVSRYLTTRTQTQELEQKNKWLLATYQLGVSHQTYGRYADALTAFEQISAYAPQYKDIAKRLNAVRSQVSDASPPPQAAAQNKQCYEMGITYGTCAIGGRGLDCSQIDIKQPPAICKNHPEFTRGFQATVGDNQGQMLKGFASYLKGL